MWGIMFGYSTVLAIVTGDLSFSIIVTSIASIMMFCASSYQIVRGLSGEFDDIPEWSVWIVVLGTVMFIVAHPAELA